MFTSASKRRSVLAAAAIAAATMTAACGGGSDNAKVTAVTAAKQSSTTGAPATSTAPPSTTAGSTTTTPATTKPTNPNAATVTGDLSGAFAGISGWSVAELPASVLEGARAQYQKETSGNSLAAGAVTDLNGRIVTRDGQPVAIILGLSLSAEVASKPGLQEAFVQGVAGSDSSVVTLSDHRATAFTQADSTNGVVFAEGRLGLLVLSAGGTAGDLQDIMAKLIAHNT